MSEFKNLPSGWKVVRLGEICEINPSSRKLPEKFYYIDLESVEKGILHSLKEVFLETAPSRAQRLLEKGDILFQMVRPYQKNNFLFELNGNFVASTGYAQIRTKQNRDFIFQYLNFDTFTKKVIEKCAGSNYPAINASVFSNLMILLPPLDEQEKIAEILSTWDEAINLAINLIESKKQFKKALMQNLLTAKIRFPQFKDEWQEMIIGELFEFKKGQGLSKEILDNNGKFECVLYGELYTTYGEIIENIKSRTNFQGSIKSKFDDILIPSSTTTGSIDIAIAAVILKNDVLLGGDINILRKKRNNIYGKFVAYYITNIKNKELSSYAQGTTIIHLYAKDFKDMKIKLPNLNEQQKIAEVLTACDDEINLLNLKLENLKKQKQGLMQKLLSGKVRTKVKGGKNVKMDD